MQTRKKKFEPQMGSTFMLKVLQDSIEIPSTVVPRYNEGPRDWQNLSAITRFRYIEFFFFIYFTFSRPRYLEFCYVEVTL